MKSDSVTNEEKRSKILNYKIPLGSFREEEMPSLFNYTENVLDSRMPYCEVLRKNPGFANPSNVEFLTQELGLSNTTGESSLFPSLQNKSGFIKWIIFSFFISFQQYFICFRYSDSLKATALRKAQTSQMAIKHVAEGIKHFKSGKSVEAFNSLNHVILFYILQALRQKC